MKYIISLLFVLIGFFFTVASFGLGEDQNTNEQSWEELGQLQNEAELEGFQSIKDLKVAFRNGSFQISGAPEDLLAQELKLFDQFGHELPLLKSSVSFNETHMNLQPALNISAGTYFLSVRNTTEKVMVN